MTQLTQEYLKQRLDYDPETGVFTWKYWSDWTPSTNSRLAGKTAGSLSGSGYLYIKLDNKSYRLHRLAWLYVYGQFPLEEALDHIDRNKLNNKISNLRPATRSANAVNIDRCPTYLGEPFVYKGRDKYRVQMRINGVATHLGTFNTIADAIKIRDQFLTENEQNLHLIS